MLTLNFPKYSRILKSFYLQNKSNNPGFTKDFCSKNNLLPEYNELYRLGLVSDQINYNRQAIVLSLELIPKTCFYNNIRTNNIYKKYWTYIKKFTKESSGNKCEVCGNSPKKKEFECHEVWQYDDTKKIQTLLEFKHLCFLCHRTKHFYNSSMAMKNWDYLFSYLMNINNWTFEITKAYLNSEESIWFDRSDYNWTQDLSFVHKFLKF